MSKDDYLTGGAVALRQVALLAQEAGKERTAAWLTRCAELVYRDGFDLRWPDAPAYKGVVVHVEAPEPDLRELTDEQLTILVRAITDENNRRQKTTGQ